MLLNLSNHPSSAWSPAQLDAAIAAYGSVEDLAFPNIPAAAGEAELRDLVAQYKEKVLQSKATHIHLMGEMTFTCALVQILQKEGVSCLASTSERTVLEEADGKKTVVFKFVRFRGYL
jgi:hypothetical protein